jgi:hypothetical protein
VRPKHHERPGLTRLQRTVASIIDAIGFLDRDGLESFHQVRAACLPAHIPSENVRQIYNAFLAMSDPSRKVSTQAKRYITNWRYARLTGVAPMLISRSNSARPPIEQQPFLVKALAVWDTVGARCVAASLTRAEQGSSFHRGSPQRHRSAWPSHASLHGL